MKQTIAIVGCIATLCVGCNFVWDLTADNDKIFGAAWSFDHDMALYSSSDSGQSWQGGSVLFPRSYPGFPDVGPPFYPSVIVLPNRTFLAMTYITPPDNSCYLRRSADQGRTWGPPHVVPCVGYALRQFLRLCRDPGRHPLEASESASSRIPGLLRVEIQDADGTPIPSFTLDDSIELYGDTVARNAKWKGDADLIALAGSPVRLCFVMRDVDLYSIKFE